MAGDGHGNFDEVEPPRKPLTPKESAAVKAAVTVEEALAIPRTAEEVAAAEYVREQTAKHEPPRERASTHPNAADPQPIYTPERIDPPPNPPTSEEVEQHAKPKTVDGVDVMVTKPEPGQAQNAEIFSQRIADAPSMAVIDQVELDVITCVGTGKLTQEQSRELSELIASAKKRLEQ